MDLDNAISTDQKAVDLTEDENPYKPDYLLNLGIRQERRFKSLRQEADFVAAVSAYNEAVPLNTAFPCTAIKAARNWAELSRRSGSLLSALA